MAALSERHSGIAGGTGGSPVTVTPPPHVGPLPPAVARSDQDWFDTSIGRWFRWTEIQTGIFTWLDITA